MTDGCTRSQHEWVARLDRTQLYWCRKRLRKQIAALQEQETGVDYYAKQEVNRRLRKTRALLALIEKHLEPS